MMETLILVGSEYLPESLMKGSRSKIRMRYSDIPQELRATEGDIRSSTGARSPSWLKKHLMTKGCEAAIPFRESLWVRCHLEPKFNGAFCLRHKNWA